MTEEIEPTAPGWRRRLPYLVAAVVFVAATWYAVGGVDVSLGDLRWGAVAALVLVGVPVLTVLNGEEFRAMARLVDRRLSFGEGLRVSVLGAAANILPVPGAALVRIGVLRRHDVAYGTATTALLLTAAAWAAATLGVAGTLLTLTGDRLLGPAGIVGGAVVAAGVTMVARRRLDADLRPLGRLFAVEAASVLVGAVRFLLVLVAVGEEVDLAQAAALTVAGVVAAATGVFPGGLGLREALAGIIGPLVQLPSRLAVLAAVGNRIAEYLVLAPVALLLARGDNDMLGLATVRRDAMAAQGERGRSHGAELGTDGLADRPSSSERRD